jgi:heme oxygenase
LAQHIAGDLPGRLKAATRDWHARAERSGVMSDLLAGAVSHEAYVALLANLLCIYRALETSLDRQVRPAMPAALPRVAALEADLHALGGALQVSLAPATLDYVQRLQELQDDAAHRLWAHVYVRYLGDLHGGQILKRRVLDRFGAAHAVRFYDFGDDSQVRTLRTFVRSRLASLPLSVKQANEVVAEAVWAFEAHCHIFEQVQPRP